MPCAVCSVRDMRIMHMLVACKHKMFHAGRANRSVSVRNALYANQYQHESQPHNKQKPKQENIANGSRTRLNGVASVKCALSPCIERFERSAKYTYSIERTNTPYFALLFCPVSARRSNGNRFSCEHKPIKGAHLCTPMRQYDNPTDACCCCCRCCSAKCNLHCKT